MGIKNLNRYLLKNCGNQAIHLTHIREFRNRTIAVDTSIYIYKYLEEEKLLENFQTLITILKNHQIRPIFIFDGKAPIEKRKLLEQRQQKKRDAEKKYDDLLQNVSSNIDKISQNKLIELKKQ